jgi:hypothetical protein
MKMVVAVGRITPNSSELTVIEGVLAMAKKETPTVPSVLIEQVEKPIPVTPPVIPPVKK